MGEEEGANFLDNFYSISFSSSSMCTLIAAL